MTTLLSLSPVLTMSSREIAELTGSTHDNVLKTVRGLVVRGVVSVNETPYVHPQNGQTYTEFLLDYRDTMVVVSGYSPELRAKIIDRWMELETQRSLNPAKLSRLQLIEMAMQAEQERLLLETRVEEMRPKVEAHDRIANAEGSLSITEAAKTLQIQPKQLFGWLRTHEWIYRRPGSATDLAYQSRLIAGLLEHKTTVVTRGDGSEKAVTQARVTSKGLTRLAQEVASSLSAI